MTQSDSSSAVDVPLGNTKFEHLSSQPENPFASLISGQKIALIPSFALESGVVLTKVPVAYKTWGQLNSNGDNAMIICHALSGSADVQDWWGPLIGPGRAFDTSRFFVVCLNSLGSPYGSASPVTMNPDTGIHYGPEFPLTTIRDDVNIHKLVLDSLGIKTIDTVIGGSMGGMLTLEWAYFGKEYVRTIVALATSARHSAWCISWGEAQRQSISVDPKYEDGYYSFEDPPVTGLGAARMSALLTYRSRNSFEARFGRNTPDPNRHPYMNSPTRRSPTTPNEEHWAVHNDGFRNSKKLTSPGLTPTTPKEDPMIDAVPRAEAGTRLDVNREEKDITPGLPPGLGLRGVACGIVANGGDMNGSGRPQSRSGDVRKAATHFSAQTYLRYQGEKFVKRFDANCYIALTRKLDTHDVSRGRTNHMSEALGLIEQPALIIGIESDGLFTYAEQQELAEGIPNARLATIDSPEGHDAFLLQFDQVNNHILSFFQENLPDIMEKPGSNLQSTFVEEVKAGTVGEVDDITAW